MALGKTVTMVFPTKNHGGIHLILTDDDRPDIGPGPQTVIEEDIIENYSGDITPAVINSLTKQAQDMIDDYRKLKANNDVSSYGAAADTISDALDLTKELLKK